MDKIQLAFFLIAFWLFLPIPLMFFNVGGYKEIAEKGSITETNPDDSVSILGIYINLLVFNIPNANFFMLRFVNFLQIISLLVTFALFWKT